MEISESELKYIIKKALDAANNKKVADDPPHEPTPTPEPTPKKELNKKPVVSRPEQPEKPSDLVHDASSQISKIQSDPSIDRHEAASKIHDTIRGANPVDFKHIATHLGVKSTDHLDAARELADRREEHNPELHPHNKTHTAQSAADVMNKYISNPKHTIDDTVHASHVLSKLDPQHHEELGKLLSRTPEQIQRSVGMAKDFVSQHGKEKSGQYYKDIAESAEKLSSPSMIEINDSKLPGKKVGQFGVVEKPEGNGFAVTHQGRELTNVPDEKSGLEYAGMLHHHGVDPSDEKKVKLFNDYHMNREQPDMTGFKWNPQSSPQSNEIQPESNMSGEEVPQEKDSSIPYNKEAEESTQPIAEPEVKEESVVASAENSPSPSNSTNNPQEEITGSDLDQSNESSVDADNNQGKIAGDLFDPKYQEPEESIQENVEVAESKVNEPEKVIQPSITRSEKWDDGTTVNFTKTPFKKLPGRVEYPQNSDVKNAMVVNVPLDDLHSTQSEVTLNGMDKTRDDTAGLPLVVQSNGIKYIQDGHHRLSKDKFSGKTSADVRFVNLDKQTEPQVNQDIESIPSSSKKKRGRPKKIKDKKEQEIVEYIEHAKDNGDLEGVRAFTDMLNEHIEGRGNADIEPTETTKEEEVISNESAPVPIKEPKVAETKEPELVKEEVKPEISPSPSQSKPLSARERLQAKLGTTIDKTKVDQGASIGKEDIKEEPKKQEPVKADKAGLTDEEIAKYHKLATDYHAAENAGKEDEFLSGIDQNTRKALAKFMDVKSAEGKPSHQRRLEKIMGTTQSQVVEEPKKPKIGNSNKPLPEGQKTLPYRPSGSDKSDAADLIKAVVEHGPSLSKDDLEASEYESSADPKISELEDQQDTIMDGIRDIKRQMVKVSDPASDEFKALKFKHDELKSKYEELDNQIDSHLGVTNTGKYKTPEKKPKEEKTEEPKVKEPKKKKEDDGASKGSLHGEEVPRDDKGQRLTSDKYAEAIMETMDKQHGFDDEDFDKTAMTKEEKKKYKELEKSAYQDAANDDDNESIIARIEKLESDGGDLLQEYRDALKQSKGEQFLEDLDDRPRKKLEKINAEMSKLLIEKNEAARKFIEFTKELHGKYPKKTKED